MAGRGVARRVLEDEERLRRALAGRPASRAPSPPRRSRRRRRAGSARTRSKCSVVERSPRSARSIGSGEHADSPANAERFDVRVERREGLLRALDEDDRPARRARAPRARARRSPRRGRGLRSARGAPAEDAEERFSHTVRRWARKAPLGRLERPRSELSARDPHARRPPSAPAAVCRASLAARYSSPHACALAPLGRLSLGLAVLCSRDPRRGSPSPRRRVRGPRRCTCSGSTPTTPKIRPTR